MKKLPIGLQDIEEIINAEYLYVDKTELIYKLISEGKYYFLSRPRRFGKSLLVSTLEQILKGNKELFKGLDIYNKIGWKEYPVIRLDFSQVTISGTQENFVRKLGKLLDEIAISYGVSLNESDILEKMRELVIKLSPKGKVVILIDEYDKPIIDNLTDKKKAEENREVLRQLYSPLKGLDKYIKFVFLTGVSKFSKVSIFSGLNNLRDITINDEFASICGITQEELIKYFNEYIAFAVNKMNMNKVELLSEIKEFYNGYSWDGKTSVYNPFSILNFFADYSFRNYWFNTGTPTFLVNCFKETNYNVVELENVVSGEIALDSIEIGNVDLISLLFQTGYITIKEVVNSSGNESYRLSYPNKEVKSSLIKYLFAGYTNVNMSTVEKIYMEMIKKLEILDIAGFEENIKSIFAGIPYNVQTNLNEYSYQTYFYIILTLVGVKTWIEVPTDKGRIDAVLELNDKIFIIEFKVGEVNEAMSQIKEKKYYERYLNQNKDIYLLGVGGFEKKDIKCLLEKIG